MTDRAVAVATPAGAVESALIVGDLSKLTEAQRLEYYRQVCTSIGLNPLTRPLEYIILNGKMTLYARKDCTDQLRKINTVSIDKPDITFQDEWIIVAVLARLPNGRTDSDVGVVNRKDMGGAFGNALMKAVTKAKRRVTLSICGLGMLDETEVETIPDARPVVSEQPALAEPASPQATRPFGTPAGKADVDWVKVGDKFFARDRCQKVYEEVYGEARERGIKGKVLPSTAPAKTWYEEGRLLRQLVEEHDAQGAMPLEEAPE